MTDSAKKSSLTVAVSDGLVSWIMQFGDQIKVEEPRRLVELIKEKTEKIANLYS